MTMTGWNVQTVTCFHISPVHEEVIRALALITARGIDAGMAATSVALQAFVYICKDIMISVYSYHFELFDIPSHAKPSTLSSNPEEQEQMKEPMVLEQYWEQLPFLVEHSSTSRENMQQQMI
jgi:hypothetical protein